METMVGWLAGWLADGRGAQRLLAATVYSLMFCGLGEEAETQAWECVSLSSACECALLRTAMAPLIPER